VFLLFGGGCFIHGSSSGSKNSPYKFFLRKNLLKNGLTTLHLFGPVKNRQVDHLVVQGQGKASDFSGVHIKFFQFEKIL